MPSYTRISWVERVSKDQVNVKNYEAVQHQIQNSRNDVYKFPDFDDRV